MSGRQLQLPEGSHAVHPAPFHDAPVQLHGPNAHLPIGLRGPHVPGGWFGGAWGVWPANTVIINNQTGWPGGGIGDTGMRGVTDGSAARPGEVGEFLYSQTEVTFGPTNQVTFNGLMLSAGSWSVEGTLQFDVGSETSYGRIMFANPPLPGQTGDFYSVFGGTTTSEPMSMTMTTPRVLFNIAAPLTLPILAYGDTGQSAYVYMTAIRIR